MNPQDPTFQTFIHLRNTGEVFYWVISIGYPFQITLFERNGKDRLFNN